MKGLDYSYGKGFLVQNVLK